VPKNRDKFKVLAAAGSLILAAGAAGLALSASSQAQDRTTATAQPARQSVTHMTYVPSTQTDSKTTTAQTIQSNPKLTYVPASRAAVAANQPATTDSAKVTKIQATQTVDPKLSAASTNVAANRPEAAASSSSATAKPTTNVAIKPATPILLRRPMAPARVQWSNAIAQSNRMKGLRPANTFVSRLPKATIDRTRLPVILPREGSGIDTAKAKMVSFGDAYALNLPQAKGLQITMYGNRSFVQTDKGAISARPVQKLAGVAEDIRISQMEDGWTATFTRYGVVYSLDVSCDDINSADCKTDAFIRKAIAQFDDVTVGADAQAEADGKMNADGKPVAAGPLDGLFNTITKMTKGG
jgi:hypothetical protein